MSVDNLVLGVIAKAAKLDASSLQSETELTTLGIASLDIIEMVFDLEEKLGISIPYNANERENNGLAFQTVGDILRLVAALMPEPEAVAP